MMLQRIVLGVDFSDASLAAARWAAIHLAPDAEVVLVHVFDEPAMSAGIRAGLAPVDAVARQESDRILGGLRGLAQLIGPSRCHTVALAGDAASTLAAFAAGIDADLVCVGRSRRRRGSPRFGAALPSRLMARSLVPTLVVDGARPGPLARIVGAIDHRATSGSVLETACGIAAAAEAQVDAMYVLEPELRTFAHAARTATRRVPHDDELVDTVDAPHAREADAIDGWLGMQAFVWVASLLDAVSADTCRTRPVVTMGDPGQELMRHAGEQGADLIIVGCGGEAVPRARAGLVHHVGSTARFLAWASPCPVLVLPPRRVRRAVWPSEAARERRRGSDVGSHCERASSAWDPLPRAATRRPLGSGGDAA